GGDDGAEVECEERDRGGRQHPGEDGIAARRDDAARERLLELGARAARVAPDEDAAALRPQRGGAAEPLDQLRSQLLADDTADPVGPEVPTGQLALRELRRLARLVQAGLLALHDPRVARQEAGALERHAELRIGL